MVNLNLPAFEYKVKKAGGKLWIFDIIRKKYVVLLPEEWVRQHFVNYLINHLQYPKSLIKVEGGLTFNTLKKRSDIVVFDRNANPWLIVECKAPQVKLQDDVVFQASVYNQTLKAKYLVVTNGFSHYYAEVNWVTKTANSLPSMPSFNLGLELL